jgi:short subunit fatty acids transporter
MKAVSECVPATGGVLIQFPFYAVIFGMIVGTGISDWLAKLFATITTHSTFPLLVAIYSAVLGVFIPSGGSKWVIEAPYVLQAANLHQVHLGWVVQIYNAAEALPNLINPFGCCRCWEYYGLKRVTLWATQCCSWQCIFRLCSSSAGSLHERWCMLHRLSSRGKRYFGSST